jgi:hypothetical protein
VLPYLTVRNADNADDLPALSGFRSARRPRTGRDGTARSNADRN